MILEKLKPIIFIFIQLAFFKITSASLVTAQTSRLVADSNGDTVNFLQKVTDDIKIFQVYPNTINVDSFDDFEFSNAMPASIAQVNTSPIQLSPPSSIPQIPPSIDPLLRDSQEPKPNPDDTPKSSQQVEPQDVILDSLTVAALRYSRIVNPTDSLTFSPELFRPVRDENYFDVDIRFSANNPIINKFTFAHFPKDEQFYWILPDNKVVIETKGWQGGILHRGRSTNQKFTQNALLEQSFIGLQAVWYVPNKLKDIIGEIDTNSFSVVSIAGQLINPPGTPAGNVLIKTGINASNLNATILENPTLNLSTGSTRSLDGGGSLFQFLDVDNAPLILQGFPTIDLRPLLNEGQVRLVKNEIIPDEVLEQSGIFWGDILTGEPSKFTAPMTSLPGLKVGQFGEFDNTQLLNILVNPFLTTKERDLYYFNSLYWFSLGQRRPKFSLQLYSTEQNEWYRSYISYAHNRSMIEYDPVDIKATYSSIFANPGFSLVASDNGIIDNIQTGNATLGMALGGLLEILNINEIEENLNEAKQSLENGNRFASLKTQATPLQRRYLNQRLNHTLVYADSISGLEQVSGKITFPGEVELDSSQIFQVRTGLHRRNVQFSQLESSSFRKGDTFFSKLQLSNEDFGFLTFVGSPIPVSQTSIRHENESSSVAILLKNTEGDFFLQQFSSADATVLPIGIRTYDLVFDRIELSRIDKQKLELSNFYGSLSLPAVEAVYSGSENNFKYSFSLGAWGNLDADSAPRIDKNESSLSEPYLGLYINGMLTLVDQQINKSKLQTISSINTYIPTLRFGWNSANNINNPFFSSFSFSYTHSNESFNFSLTPAIALIGNSSNAFISMFLNASLEMRQGLKFDFDLDYGEQIFLKIQGFKKINENTEFGLFLKNFNSNKFGLENRSLNLNGGLIFRQNFIGSNKFLEVQLGISSNGTDIKVEGGLRL
ncbi:hypothetical protein [Nostoc parmelioides]|uniref:Uncharacterized protein n=1 Tax=Nostoc parmelioides FACHB-3921 TaxID=2692909 RepID=A0ABR8BLY4_9NOSO|nr:hypothetical protein [Nostoc parmelioides]MBD2254550.1 hypothetical protein [Nostoc parmelioides FACHB-3921]